MPHAKILIADDDKVTLNLLGVTLQKAGYQIVTAQDAMQAVMTAHRLRPDAILLDVMMPGGGGMGVLKKLKASSQTQLIPVVAMSSSPEPELQDHLLAEGAHAFLKKPVDLVELRGVLGRLLEEGRDGS